AAPAMPFFSNELWQALADGLSRPVDAAAPAPRWPWGLALFFGLVTSLGLAHLAAGLWAVRAYRRRSRPITDCKLDELVDVLSAELSLTRKIELRQCDGLVTAATVGWLRPLVLLPPEWSAWSPAEQRTVLAHELAHIARHDFLGVVLGQVSVA